MRRVSSTPSSSSWNGSGVERERISSSSAWISISPVVIDGLTVSGERRTTGPRARTTNSFRSCVRHLGGPGRVHGVDHDLDDSPSSSRRSTKTSPPWSRRVATQPATVTSGPRPRGAASCRVISRQRVIVERSWEVGERNRLLGRPPAPDHRAVGADDHDRARAGPASLRELALERAAGVVGVAGDPASTQIGHAASGPARAGRRRRRRRRRGRVGTPSRLRSRARAAIARSRPRSRSRASAARRSARRGRRSARRRRASTVRLASGPTNSQVVRV